FLNRRKQRKRRKNLTLFSLFPSVGRTLLFIFPLCSLCLCGEPVLDGVRRFVRRLLVVQGLEKGDQVIQLMGFEMTRLAVHIFFVTSRQHVAQGFCLAVMEIGSGPVHSEERGRVILGSDFLGGVVA